MTERILKMPRLGETMEEGKVAGWLIKPGDRFRRGDAIIEIETDKTVAEYPALGDGILNETLASTGDVLVVGAPLARIDIGAGPDWTAADGDTDAEKPPSADTAPALEKNNTGLIETELEMPRLGETMEEGRIVKWLKAPGEAFTRGEAIIEIETDKTVAEFPALTDGTLVDILHGEGDMVTVGDAIARIRTVASHVPGSTHPAAPSVENIGASPGIGDHQPRAPIDLGHGPVRATPLARRLARQNGLDIRQLLGTGRRARIEKADVLAAIGGATIRPAITAATQDVLFAELPRGKMAYLDNRTGTGKPILLLHGFAGDRTTWATVAAGLRRTGRRVLIPDLPAHGLTEIGAASADDLSVDLEAFLDRVASRQSVQIVAHSLGAVAAIDLASALPGRVGCLDFITPAGLGLEIDADFIFGMANAKTPGEIAHLLRRLTVGRLELSPAALGELAQDLARGRLVALADSILGPAGQTVDRLGRVNRLAEAIPIRILAGIEDRIIPWRHAMSVSPRVALHLFARSGHMPQWDQPGEVVDIILSGTR
ncbi:acetoin dehydrogenase dihydrolipoyllysine-residue acetyltransferase subunit [Mesorhizobium sp. M0938]|uniref:acetoin dehydrogenase dihydrolipoyllysine-residue acetyltransferase subunit n=1 Tax=unclassified Mesorhizobium TaxID=325217 RepID=UPI00333CBD16